MNAKDYLQQIKKISIELAMLEREINDMYSPIKAVSYGNVPGTPDFDATLHIVERIDYLQKQYSRQMEELTEKRKQCVDVIMRMQNEAAEKVIYLRYVKFKSYGFIAREMSYSKGRIMQLHREGLKEIDNILATLHIITL